MLPAPYRMRRSTDFAHTLRAGRRVRRGVVVVHQLIPEVIPEPGPPAGTPPLVGLVVSRAVGGSVVRHRVSRRLRAQLAGRVELLPPCSRTVVRALPGAAQARGPRLGADLEQALRSVVAAR